MKKTIIRFWGVRGSIPVPGTETQKTGGNTSCVEVVSGSARVIFDAGTGIRALGDALLKKKGEREIHLFLSHYHLDHIIGIPFFAPLYQKDIKLQIYGPKSQRDRAVDEILDHLFAQEFFPVPLSSVSSRIEYHPLEDDTVIINPFSITSFDVNHPGRSLGFLLENNGKKLAYLPDHECITHFNHLDKSKNNFYQERLVETLKGADILIHDAQYWKAEYKNHRGWGHSTWEDALHLAQSARVKTLVLFHHAPHHTDTGLNQALVRFKKVAKDSKIKIVLAREGAEIEL